MTQSALILLSGLRESFAKVAYSHKTHEKMADRIARNTKWLKRVEILLLALTTGGSVAVLVADKAQYEIVTVLLASIALLVTLYQYRFSPEDVARAHRNSALKLWHIREKYCALIGDLLSGALNEREARIKRDNLLAELNSVYEVAPESDAKAYKAAQDALQLNEELSFTEGEIDDLLPSQLRTTAFTPRISDTL